MQRTVYLLTLLVAVLLPGLATAVPPIQNWTLESGTRVYFVESRSLPIVDIRLTFDAAAARDGDLPGLASLTNGLLDQGNGGLNAGEIARRLESVGARLSGGSQRDMAWLQLRSLAESKTLEPAVDTLALIVGSPDFPATAFARQKARMLVGLQAVKQSPSDLGERAFYRTIYGDHPYAMPPSGTEESLAKITRDDVVAFYRKHYTAGNAVIAIVGDLDRAQAAALADRIADSLPDGPAAEPLPPVTPPDEARKERVPFKSAQTHIMIGQPAIDRRSPDTYAITVGNHILGGGGLVSILAATMRDERGLSYSSSSYAVMSAQPGPFVMQTQVRNDSAEEAVEVLRNTFAEFLREGPTEQQLNLAIRNITGSFPLSLDSNGDIVGYLAMIGFYGLPLDYLATYQERIRAVTAKDVQAAFRRHLNPDTLATVLVGPPPRDTQQ